MERKRTFLLIVPVFVAILAMTVVVLGLSANGVMAQGGSETILIAGLEVGKMVTPTMDVVPGDIVTYTITISNSSQMSMSVAFTDTLPREVDFLNWVGPYTATVVNNEIRWQRDVLSNTELDFSFTARVLPMQTIMFGGPVTNTVLFASEGATTTVDAVFEVGTDWEFYQIFLPILVRGFGS